MKNFGENPKGRVCGRLTKDHLFDRPVRRPGLHAVQHSARAVHCLLEDQQQQQCVHERVSVYVCVCARVYVCVRTYVFECICLCRCARNVSENCKINIIVPSVSTTINNDTLPAH